LRGEPLLGPVAYLGGYVVLATLQMPVWLLAATAGFLWGVGEAVPLVALANALAAALNFLLARTLLGGVVARLVVRSARWEAIQTALSGDARRVAMLLRLAMFIPFNLVNYAFGLSGARLRTFLGGATIGALPVIAMQAWGGTLLGTIEALWNAQERFDPTWTALATGVGLGAVIAACVLVARAAGRALRRPRAG